MFAAKPLIPSFALRLFFCLFLFLSLGGKRCAEPNCPKGAEGATDKCVAHGGGKRCSVERCDKLRRGPSGCCRVHGGGQRCGVDGCEKNAVGPLKLCVSHGMRELLVGVGLNFAMCGNVYQVVSGL